MSASLVEANGGLSLDECISPHNPVSDRSRTHCNRICNFSYETPELHGSPVELTAVNGIAWAEGA